MYYVVNEDVLVTQFPRSEPSVLNGQGQRMGANTGSMFCTRGTRSGRLQARSATRFEISRANDAPLTCWLECMELS